MKRLVSGARAGDKLFFYCKTSSVVILFRSYHLAYINTVSGHGMQVDDMDSDEIDGKDEG